MAALATLTLGTSFAAAAPAAAGGIGDFLSPAFGTTCANTHTAAHPHGSTTQESGTLNSNLAGLPLGSALNQCGGADEVLNTARYRAQLAFLNGNAQVTESALLGG
ncbi:hypothetical protein [Streptomyces sp. NPDC057325]|uniref:hypothetical protein n=1 Tax=unclassified Streptomyces TaxID=2593676 RepID=UPI0036388181